MIKASKEESREIYKKRILEINETLMEAVVKGDKASIKQNRDIMTFMVDKYLKGLDYE